MPIKFYNSLEHRAQDFKPLHEGKVGIYTCGPTVYNFAHIGNFRAYIFEDLLKRTLMLNGLEINHIMNLTDVDDKTIRGALTNKIPLNDFTKPYKEAFFNDIKALRIIPANKYPAATDHVPEMIEIIKVLFDKGIAYQAEDKSVYFSLAKWPKYGQLVHIDHDQMLTGARFSMDEYTKESVGDFALWKAWDEKDGDVGWDSPWGKGRPGWHIECSAMSSKYLGKTFDIHCGGIDNMFPHHEDEIAQSEAANGCKFVNYWLHCAHLMVEGQKMSKSAGNFFTLRDILQKGYTGREIRWVLIATHYRQSLNFSFKALDDARTVIQRIEALIARLKDNVSLADAGIEEATKIADEQEAKFKDALNDDLNISAALASLFDLLHDLNRQLDKNECSGKAAQIGLDALKYMDQVLCVCEPDATDDVPAEIQKMADDRQAARKAKDYATADALRNKLDELGWVIEDTAKGPRVKRK